MLCFLPVNNGYRMLPEGFGMSPPVDIFDA